MSSLSYPESVLFASAAYAITVISTWQFKTKRKLSQIFIIANDFPQPRTTEAERNEPQPPTVNVFYQEIRVGVAQNGTACPISRDRPLRGRKSLSGSTTSFRTLSCATKFKTRQRQKGFIIEKIVFRRAGAEAAPPQKAEFDQLRSCDMKVLAGAAAHSADVPIAK
jgi:hypothetical protein